MGSIDNIKLCFNEVHTSRLSESRGFVNQTDGTSPGFMDVIKIIMVKF
jgi:hypothetical protein